MGLVRDWLRSKRMDDPVRGTAYIAGCSRYTESATSSNIVMTLVVSADGLPATTVEHECFCRHDRWPSAGDTLPVTVDRSDPSRLDVLWEEVVTHEERVREHADAMAEQLRGNPTTDALVAQLQQAFPGAQIAVSQETIDASVDPSSAEQLRAALAGFGQPAAPAPDDPVARLERLAALHAAGALSDAEFAAAKAKILGSP